MIPLVAWPFVGLGAAWLWAKRRGNNSDGAGDVPESPGADCDYMLADSIGWPYWFGKGTPGTPWSDGPKGVDCAGYAQMALVRLGLLSSSASDRGATSLANDSNPVPIGEQRVGDLAIYPGHVMVVAAGPRGDGHSPVIGAASGTSTTFGTDPNARVKLFSSALYWPTNSGGFLTYARLRK